MDLVKEGIGPEMHYGIMTRGRFWEKCRCPHGLSDPKGMRGKESWEKDVHKKGGNYKSFADIVGHHTVQKPVLAGKKKKNGKRFQMKGIQTKRVQTSLNNCAWVLNKG